MPDCRSRAKQADDSTSSHCSGADVKDIRLANIVGSHLADRNGSGCNRPSYVVTEKVDRWNQDEVREHAACAHNRGDRWPDNITDTEQSWLDSGGDRGAFKRRTKDFLRRVLPHSERAHGGLVKKTDSKTGEDHFSPAARRFWIDDFC